MTTATKPTRKTKAAPQAMAPQAPPVEKPPATTAPNTGDATKPANRLPDAPKATESAAKPTDPKANGKPAKATKKNVTLTADEKAEILDKICALEDDRRKLEEQEEMAKEELKEIRAKLEGITARIFKYANESGHPELFPLFNGKNPSNNGTPAKDSKGPVVEVKPADDSWRKVPLAEAMPDLAKGTMVALYKAEITTVGQLADFTAKASNPQGLSGIKGVGPAANTKIQDAMAGFWQRRASSAVAGAKPSPAPAEQDAQAKLFATEVGALRLPADTVTILTANKILTVGDLDRLAKKEGMTYLDVLRNNLKLDLISADQVVSAVKALTIVPIPAKEAK